jgi:hypothetical protein
MLINAGIVDIYFKEGYADSLSAVMLDEAGIPYSGLGEEK